MAPCSGAGSARPGDTVALTGNYAFFNLLSASLCILLVDDRVFERLRAVVGRARMVRKRPVLDADFTLPPKNADTFG